MSLKTGMFLPGCFCQKASFPTAADHRINDKKTPDLIGQTFKGMKSEEKLSFGGLQRGSSFLKAFFFFCGD